MLRSLVPDSDMCDPPDELERRAADGTAELEAFYVVGASANDVPAAAQAEVLRQELRKAGWAAGEVVVAPGFRRRQQGMRISVPVAELAELRLDDVLAFVNEI